MVSRVPEFFLFMSLAKLAGLNKYQVNSLGTEPAEDHPSL